MPIAEPKFSRRAFLALTGGAVLCPGFAGAMSLPGVGGAAFGTSWSVLSEDTGLSTHLVPNITTIFDEIDRQMSPWRIDSTISRINAGRAGRYPVKGAFYQVAQAALALAQDSAGCFDPTVGPLVAQWGFGPVQGEKTPNWAGVRCREGQIEKDEAGVTLDLCGIAKGFALDRAVEEIRAQGIGSALFDLGGELAAVGQHPSGRAWQVAIEPPHAATDPILLSLPSGRAIATSGLAAQSFDLSGQRYGHIIDPHRGHPATSGLFSVSVIADTAMAADGWATALFAAGSEAGPKLAAARGIDAIFLSASDDVPLVTTGSAAEGLL